MRRHRLLALVASALATVLTVLLAGSPPAQAIDRPCAICTYYRMIDHTVDTNRTNYGDRIAIVHAGSTGINASIAAGKTATRTIQAGFGVDAGWVAGQLNISSASSVTVTQGCSAKLSAGQDLAAYSYGSYHYYRVRKEVWQRVGLVDQSTSGVMTTFNPYVSGISCRVE